MLGKSEGTDRWAKGSCCSHFFMLSFVNLLTDRRTPDPVLLPPSQSLSLSIMSPSAWLCCKCFLKVTKSQITGSGKTGSSTLLFSPSPGALDNISYAQAPGLLSVCE